MRDSITDSELKILEACFELFKAAQFAIRELTKTFGTIPQDPTIFDVVVKLKKAIRQPDNDV